MAFKGLAQQDLPVSPQKLKGRPNFTTGNMRCSSSIDFLKKLSFSI
jgi:hypothetical protein